ncbi:hypothetical protein Efla_002864 [Eimeria flavescens]
MLAAASCLTLIPIGRTFVVRGDRCSACERAALVWHLTATSDRLPLSAFLWRSTAQPAVSAGRVEGAVQLTLERARKAGNIKVERRIDVHRQLLKLERFDVLPFIKRSLNIDVG